MKSSKKGRFRIQSVAEMTGVPASTLRAWEQRYGFPSPERTASAYRVYSHDDVELIARVRALCDGGMAPAEAVQEVLESGHGAPPPPTPRADADGPLVDRIVNAAREVVPSELDSAIRSALMLGSPSLVFESAIEPAWSQLRALSTEGTLDAGAERIASEVLAHAARDLIRNGQPPAPRGHALLAVLPGCEDIVPLVRAAFTAQARGLRCALLSPGATASAIGRAAEHLDAEVVALAVTDRPTGRRAREIFDDIAARVGERPWSVCGPDVEALREVVEGAGGSIDHAP